MGTPGLHQRGPGGGDAVLSRLAFDANLLAGSGACTWRGVLKAAVIGQVVALPLGLMMGATGGQVLEKIVVSSIYSHCIAQTCSFAARLTLPRIASWPTARQGAVLTLQFFLSGVVGSEVARLLLVAVYGSRFHSPRLLTWAIGATVATIVAGVLITVRDLSERVEQRERELRDHEVVEARLQQARSDAELAALEARINPHFLFNTLNSIAELIREEPERAEAVTLQLSSLFRYALQAPKVGMVSLEEELVIVRGYLDIEQVRLGSRLRHVVEVEPGLLPVRLPPLTLQPLVENAIRHGVSADVSGGLVTVRGWAEDGRVQLAVINTGSGRPNPGTGEGLQSVRGRLRAAYGDQGQVTLQGNGPETEARVCFPHST